MQEQKLTGYPSIDKPWLKYYSEEEINAPMPECTIYEYLWEKNKNHLDDIALIFCEQEISYYQLFENIDKVARAFRAINIKAGNIVTICLPNIPEAIYIFYALNRLGAICDFLDPRATDKVMLEHLNLSNAKLLVTISNCYNSFLKLKDATTIQSIIVLNVNESAISFTANGLFEGLTFQDFIAKGTETNEFADVQYDYPICILHTGGTTGIPKGVLLSNRNFHSLTIQYQSINLFHRGYTLLSLMPPFVSFGLTANMHVPLSLGVTLILIPEYAPEKIIDQINHFRPNCIPASPAHWEIIFRDDRVKYMDLSFVKFGFIGGDTLNPMIEEGINIIFQKTAPDFYIVKGYGMTESTTAISVPFNKSINKTLSVGVPLPQTIVSLFDEADNELTYNTAGEVCIQSNGVMLEYYNNAEATNTAIRRHSDGLLWLHTGDIGMMTEDGLLYIKGRIKRIIIRFDGIKIYSIDIESKIIKCEIVKNCAVVGMQDPSHMQGQVPIAFIVLKNDNVEAKKILNAYCKENIIDYAVPYEYVIIDEIPLTPNGKIDYRLLEVEAAKICKS